MKNLYYIYMDGYTEVERKIILDLLGPPTPHCKLPTLSLFEGTEEELTFLSLQLPNFYYRDLATVESLFKTIGRTIQ